MYFTYSAVSCVHWDRCTCMYKK